MVAGADSGLSLADLHSLLRAWFTLLPEVRFKQAFFGTGPSNGPAAVKLRFCFTATAEASLEPVECDELWLSRGNGL